VARSVKKIQGKIWWVNYIGERHLALLLPIGKPHLAIDISKRH